MRYSNRKHIKIIFFKRNKSPKIPRHVNKSLLINLKKPNFKSLNSKHDHMWELKYKFITTKNITLPFPQISQIPTHLNLRIAKNKTMEKKQRNNIQEQTCCCIQVVWEPRHLREQYPLRELHQWASTQATLEQESIGGEEKRNSSDPS